MFIVNLLSIFYSRGEKHNSPVDINVPIDKTIGRSEYWSE